MQKILIMTTERPELRASADGWTAEDGNQIRLDKEIGLSYGYRGRTCYDTPMHAIGDGWRLLAPPIEHGTYYQWWFEKE